MRTVSSNIINAIDTTPTYAMRAKLKIQKNRIYFSSIDSNYAYTSASPAGWQDDIVPQDIVYPTSGSALVTFYNMGNQLKYTTEGDSNLVTVSSGDISGKPSVVGSYLFRVRSNGNLYRYNIDFAATQSHNVSVLSAETLVGTPTSGSGAVHAISQTEVVYMMEDNGGIRPIVYTYSGSWSAHPYAYRFMFPKRYESDHLPNITVSQMAYFSGAAKLGNKIFVYQSNLLTGVVDGVYYDIPNNDWSDIFTSVPTDLSVSLCEFRVLKCYSHDSHIYIVGQFRRTDPAEVIQPYNMILSSEDGKIFSINRMSLVSTQGYRYQALVTNDYLYLAGDNRVSKKPVTYYFSPTSGSSGYSLDVYTGIDIVSLNDNNSESCSLRLAAGNNTLLDSGYLDIGNRIILDIGYNTSGSSYEFANYGTYILDSPSLAFRNGQQTADINCVNESIWHLVGLTSPFYTEIISKSSLFTDFSDSSYWSDTVNGGVSENKFSIDFWKAEEYTSGSISSVDIGSDNGGLNPFITSGAHSLGISSGDIVGVLGSKDYPICVSSPISVNVFGWSYSLAGDDVNDTVGCRLIMESSGSAHNEYYIEGRGKRFQNTYLESSGSVGDYPIQYNIPATVGDKIKQVVLIFECSQETSFYPHRVDVVGGTTIGFPYSTGALWDFTSGSGAEIPGKMRPYIMTATRPYNAWNFQLAASFNNTISSGSFPCSAWVGLTGHLYDSNNYIVGRYDKTSGQSQIAKVRDRVETVLTSGSSYTSGSAGDIDIMFTHRDGTFVLYAKVGSEWVSILSYDWQATDGYMLVDSISSLDSGIYGFINPPYFRTTGFELSTTGDHVNAVGIPMLPGYNKLSEFPTTGVVDIDDVVYSYTGKLACDPIRGPSQYRNNARWSPPFGNGPAMEITDHDWLKAAGYLTGKWAAMDDGYVFPILNSLWQPWITTDGQRVDLPGRSRFYSTEIVSLSAHDLSNRVYLTGGLTGVKLVSGNVGYHSWGSDVVYHVDGHLMCDWFYGSSGDYDATVRDLIDHISKISGAKAVFRGDKVVASQAINGTYTAGSIGHSEGYDLYFTTDLASGQSVQVVSDTVIYEGDTESAIQIQCLTGTTYNVSMISKPSNVVIDSFSFTLNASGKFRVLYHDNFATVYVNDRWLFTFCPETITYPVTMTIEIVTSTSITLTDITLTELCDWREAVYIDFETDSKSAIGSVIQERPVEVYSRSDGAISYWYIPTRDQIDQVAGHIKDHGVTQSIPKNSSSDAIVYYSEVGTINNENYARDYGFTTRVYRMPSLSSGAIRAASIIQQREFEASRIHSLTIRPDVRIQQGDVLNVVYTAVGTNRAYNFMIVVTDVSLRMSGEGADSVMMIQGRSI